MGKTHISFTSRVTVWSCSCYGAACCALCAPGVPMSRSNLLLSTLISAVITLAVGGCDAPKDDNADESAADSAIGDSYVVPIDNDGDGVVASSDCDDNDATLYPGRGEDCDG